MITEEQIKKLKPGDIIYLNNYPVTFCDTSFSKSTILAKDDASNCGSGDRCWFTLEYLTMQPQPKYSPCRLFKEGDEVRYCERDGRSYVYAPPVGAPCRVCGGEDRVGMVCIEFKFSENEESALHEVPFYHLELVTPVEEVEPYFLSEGAGIIELYKGTVDEVVKTWFYDSVNDGVKALAAAEAERDRLNSEYRKEWNNG